MSNKSQSIKNLISRSHPGQLEQNFNVRIQIGYGQNQQLLLKMPTMQVQRARSFRPFMQQETENQDSSTTIQAKNKTRQANLLAICVECWNNGSFADPTRRDKDSKAAIK